MTDLMGKDRCHSVLVFATSEHPAGHEYQSAGRGKGVDFIRAEDQKMVSSEGLRQFRSLSQYLSEYVQKHIRLGIVIRSVFGGNHRSHCAADVVFLLRCNVLKTSGHGTGTFTD